MIYAPDDDMTIGQLIENIPAQPRGHIDGQVADRLATAGIRLPMTLAQLRAANGLIARALLLIKEGGKTSPGGDCPTGGTPAQIAVAA